MTHKQAILRYIELNGSITPMQAFSDLGITKLATVVSEMRRKDGIEFNKELVSDVNRYGNKVQYMKYTLAGGQNG